MINLINFWGEIFIKNKIFLVCACIFYLSFINGSELTVNIENQKKSGFLFLAIYDDAKAYQEAIDGGGEELSEDGSVYNEQVYLNTKPVHKLIINIPDGEYAMVFFIDANENKKLDKNFIGIPKEQYGFSNNAMGAFSAPTFEQAKFTVLDKANQNIMLN